MSYRFTNERIGETHVIECPIPKHYQSGYDQCELDFTAAHILEGTKALIYWYGSGIYEGAGRALAIFDDGSVGSFDLGHCSCNGPLDDFPIRSEGDTLAEHLKRMSAEERQSFETIEFAIRQAKRGKKL